MFSKKNPIYYSPNKDLGKPEVESEEDFVGELHTATEVIAQVEDEEGAQEIVKRVNMHEELIEFVKSMAFIYSSETNYPEGTMGARYRNEAQELLTRADKK